MAIAEPRGANASRRKSQIALELLYRARDEDENVWLFWVPASDEARFKEGYRRIADVAQLPGRNMKDVDMLEHVLGWLDDWSGDRRWIMVLDDATDPEVFFNKSIPCNESGGTCKRGPRRDLAAFLPTTRYGTIILTSQNEKIRPPLVRGTDRVLNVATMREEHAVALLRKKCNATEPMVDGQMTHDEVDLVHALNKTPIAISLAAAYIRYTPNTTVSAYLQLLQESEHHSLKLLSSNPDDLPTNSGVSASLMTTWYISFLHIRERHPQAARLLQLMSLFDPQEIPGDLLRNRYQQDPQMASSLEHDVRILADYSLLEVSHSNHSFKLPHVVRLAVKAWLEHGGEMQVWQETYISILNATFPLSVYKTWGAHEAWPECQRLIPHAKMLLHYNITEGDYAAQRAAILRAASTYASQQGNHDVEVQMNQEVLHYRENTLGAEHPRTLDSISDLAGAYWARGQLQEAEELFLPLLDRYKTVMGAEHPYTLTTMNNIAGLYRAKGQLKEAEDLTLEAMKVHISRASTRKSNGKSPEDFEASMEAIYSANALGQTYIAQGRSKEAEALFQQTIIFAKASIGEVHPLTLTLIRNAAFAVRQTGNYKDAIYLIEACIERETVVLGPDHPDTVSSRRILRTWKAEAERQEL